MTSSAKWHSSRYGLLSAPPSGLWKAPSPRLPLNGSFPSSRGQGCDRQMIFDMLKRLPNDYVCKKVSGWGGRKAVWDSQPLLIRAGLEGAPWEGGEVCRCRQSGIAGRGGRWQADPSAPGLLGRRSSGHKLRCVSAWLPPHGTMGTRMRNPLYRRGK